MNRHMCMSHCVLVNILMQETNACLNNMTLTDQNPRIYWCPDGASMKRDEKWCIAKCGILCCGSLLKEGTVS